HVARGLSDKPRRGKIIARPVRQPIRVGVALRSLVRELPETVTLPAHLRGAFRIQLHRLDDRRVAVAVQVEEVPARRVRARADVRLAGTVGAFTRDAELNGFGVDVLREQRLTAVRRAELRPPQRGVTLHADAVPASALRKEREARWMHRRRTSREPSL